MWVHTIIFSSTQEYSATLWDTKVLLTGFMMMMYSLVPVTQSYIMRAGRVDKVFLSHDSNKISSVTLCQGGSMAKIFSKDLDILQQ